MQLHRFIWPYLAILSFLVVAITNTDALLAPLKIAIEYTVAYTYNYSLHWPWNLINMTCLKHRQSGAFIITSLDLFAFNLAILNSVDMAFAFTRLAQGAWAAAVAVCVVGVISPSLRAVTTGAVALASFVTILALFFVTWNLREILEYRPAF